MEGEVDSYKEFIDYADEMFQISMGSRRSKKVEEAKITPTTAKPKPRRPATLSTTPDLSRKPIA